MVKILLVATAYVAGVFSFPELAPRLILTASKTREVTDVNPTDRSNVQPWFPLTRNFGNTSRDIMRVEGRAFSAYGINYSANQFRHKLVAYGSTPSVASC